MVALEEIGPVAAASVPVAGGILALLVAALFLIQLRSYNDGSKAFRVGHNEWVRPLPTGPDDPNGQSAFWTPNCDQWSEEQKRNFQLGAPNARKISGIVQCVCSCASACTARAWLRVLTSRRASALDSGRALVRSCTLSTSG